MSARTADALGAAAPVRAAREALAGERAWIVGGTVRDAILGRPVRDVDLAVDGDPEAAARALAKALRAPVFPLSEAFGAWRVVDREGKGGIDVARLQGDTIEADLGARDFTVNAIAVPLEGGEPIDPLGGAADLEARVLRVASAGAYASDPLRPLRLVRLAAELGLAPEPETERLTAAAAEATATAAPERVFAELRRLIAADAAASGIALADRLGLLRALLPEVSELHGVEQSDFHHLDVYGHTLEVLERQIALERELPDRFGDDAARLAAILAEPLADELTRAHALRLGALLHDVGKPATRSIRRDGRITFIGHDDVGEGMVRALLRRLRTSERLAAFVGGLARHHLRLGFLVHERPLPRRTVYRYLKASEPVAVEVTLLSCADRLATRGRRADEAIEAHLELARELMAEALDWRAEPPRPPVRGDELAQALGIEPGPELGRILGELEQAAFAGEAATPGEALAYARRLREDPAQ
jgi:putative nucleotidyltransferase with HDIG domain